jgi:two-component system LytT family response regulator
MLKKVLLIDDEAPARNLLREYLGAYEDLVIVGEAHNGVDALRLITEHDPEILFLDVQMPGLTGLEVLTRLEELPLVVFSTAYDHYALEAFELHAVDYLLKPYTQERFGQAIERLRERMSSAQPGVAKLTQHLHDQAATNYPDRIMVSRGNKYVALPVKDILCIRADGDYSSILTTDRTFLTQYGLGETERRLNPDIFLRIHRSTIINRQAIREIYREGHGFDVILNNGEIVRASRGYADTIKELLF